MYPRIPWELVADTLGSAEHPLGTTGLDNSRHQPDDIPLYDTQKASAYC
jgi:hypothetical protein